MAKPDRIESLKTLKWANLDGAFATAFGTLVGGAFLVGFIKSIHASDIWIGALSALPSLLGILQIPGAIWGRRQRSFKRFVAPGGFIWRLLYIVMPILPLVPLAGGMKLGLLVLAVIVATISVQLVNPIYSDWLAELVPLDARARFFAVRNSILTGVGSASGIVGGLVLDEFKRRGELNPGLAVIFGLGWVCSMVSFYFFMRMQDLPRQTPDTGSLKASLRDFITPFADKNFQPLLCYFVAGVFAQAFASAYYAAYALEVLKLPFTVITLYGATQSFGVIVSSRFWSFVADRFGHKPTLAISATLLAINPLIWVLGRPNDLAFNIALFLPAHVMFGFFWSGVGLTQFTLLINSAPEANRSIYIGAGNALNSLIGGISPLLGGVVLVALEGHFPLQYSYQVLFAIVMVLRLLAPILLSRVKEPGSANVRTAIGQLTSARPAGVRALRRLSKENNVKAREEAIDEIREEGLVLAGDALVKALTDPQPQIRRSAASALAQLRDPSVQDAAAEALTEQISQHPEFVEEEMVEALGQLGHENAVQPLIRLLGSPRPMIRRAAARALGRLGYASAVVALSEAAQSGDSDLRRAALQALRAVGAKEGGAVAIECLRDPFPGVRSAAAELVAELEVADAAPVLRSILSEPELENASSLAYALGVVGNLSDLPLVLKAAQTCTRPTTRRQSLLGAARLLGAESQAYRLFLIDGMERDRALVELMRGPSRRNRSLVTTLRLYSQGNEDAALESLVQALPELNPLLEWPVDEAFLVGVAYCASRHEAERN